MAHTYYTAQSFSNYYNILSTEINSYLPSINLQLSQPENIRDNYLISEFTKKINILKAIQSEIKTFPSNTVYMVSDIDLTDYYIHR